jgi:Ca2+-binding EF-hand superfamily protein
VRLGPSDELALFQFYRESGANLVNYRVFLESIEIARGKVQEDDRPVAAPVTAGVTVSDQVRDIVRRFKSFCVQYKIAYDSIFRDYDASSRRTGAVRGDTVEACLHNIGFDLKAPELRALLDAFKEPKTPEYFSYVQFNQFVRKEDISRPEVKAALGPFPISNEVEREALIACGQIREKLMARHRRIWTAFAGLADDPIPVDEFKKRLNSVDLVVRATQYVAIFRKYQVNLTDQIDWKQFCTDVDASKTLGGF